VRENFLSEMKKLPVKENKIKVNMVGFGKYEKGLCLPTSVLSLRRIWTPS